jgi:hypothetical protein
MQSNDKRVFRGQATIACVVRTVGHVSRPAPTDLSSFIIAILS